MDYLFIYLNQGLPINISKHQDILWYKKSLEGVPVFILPWTSDLINPPGKLTSWQVTV